MIKAVIDSNVWIRALLTPGPARELIGYFEREAFLCFYPDQLIRELQRVPNKRKLARIRIETLVALIDFIVSAKAGTAARDANVLDCVLEVVLMRGQVIRVRPNCHPQFLSAVVSALDYVEF
ncbi:MAG TPA: hypothetical protein V6D08_00110 [Candidatus Obscuribacterales bacterium]